MNKKKFIVVGEVGIEGYMQLIPKIRIFFRYGILISPGMND